MHRFHLPVVGVIFFYFAVNAIFMFWHGHQWGALCCLTIAVSLPLAILGVNTFSASLPLLLFFSVISIYQDFYLEMLKPENQYFEYVLSVIGEGYYGEHEEQVMLACSKQPYKDMILFTINLFKALYYDIVLSALDFLITQFSEPVPNQCLVAVDNLIADYPEFQEKIPNKQIN